MIKIKEIKTLTGLSVEIDKARASAYVSKHLPYILDLFNGIYFEDKEERALNHVITSYCRKTLKKPISSWYTCKIDERK